VVSDSSPPAVLALLAARPLESLPEESLVIKSVLKTLVHHITSTPTGERAVVALGALLRGRADGLLRRIAPPPVRFAATEVRRVERNGLRWELRPCDYFQWHQYFRLHDPLAALLPALHEPRAACVDVGANIGWYALLLATAFPDGLVYAFEPNPSTAAALDRNVALNGVQNVVVRRCAVADRPGTATLFDTGSGDSGKYSLRGGVHGVDVPVETLDEALADVKRPVSLIKIDVEGFEPEVLLGASRTIEAHRPHIVFESTPRWYEEKRSALRDALSVLEREGYRTYDVRADGGRLRLEPVSFASLERGPQRNVLAASASRSLPSTIQRTIRGPEARRVEVMR
jgi:FkbM family methyltransferase